MGVYIKGMEMPKNCLECEIRAYDANAGEEYCPFSQIVCLSIGRQDNCPLVDVEVPESHGRLIDADALEPDADYDDGEFWAYSVVQVCSAQAVIEAERTDK